MKPSQTAPALLALLLAGCGTAASPSAPIPAPTMTSGPSASPPATPFELVTFTTDDGVTLSGTLIGSGAVAVLLAHQGTPGANQTTWQPFARLLAERGLTALAFDFRGVGESAGELHYRDLWKDVKAATQFLRGRGHSQIVCAGASMGGTACIYDAATEQYTGLIALSSTMSAGRGDDSLRVTDEVLAGLTLPKLFITADADYYSVVVDTRHMAELSPDPKTLVILSGTAHGTRLFATEAGQQLTTSLLEFLDGIGS
jgi:pimeloyl-ACP methyl ester carboxylesterase